MTHTSRLLILCEGYRLAICVDLFGFKLLSVESGGSCWLPTVIKKLYFFGVTSSFSHGGFTRFLLPTYFYVFGTYGHISICFSSTHHPIHPPWICSCWGLKRWGTLWSPKKQGTPANLKSYYKWKKMDKPNCHTSHDTGSSEGISGDIRTLVSRKLSWHKR